MSGIEKIIAAGIFGGCFAVLAVVVGVAAGGDRQMLMAVLQHPVNWLLWPGAIGVVGGAAREISKV